MPDTTENCQHQENVWESLRLELNFTYPLQQVNELNVLGERISSVAVDKFGAVEKIILELDNVAPQQIILRIFLLKYRYFGSFPPNFLPTPHNEIFAILNTQPRNMLLEKWILIANSCPKLLFAESLRCEKVQFPQNSSKSSW